MKFTYLLILFLACTVSLNLFAELAPLVRNGDGIDRGNGGIGVYEISKLDKNDFPEEIFLLEIFQLEKTIFSADKKWEPAGLYKPLTMNPLFKISEADRNDEDECKIGEFNYCNDPEFLKNFDKSVRLDAVEFTKGLFDQETKALINYVLDQKLKKEYKYDVLYRLIKEIYWKKLVNEAAFTNQDFIVNLFKNEQDSQNNSNASLRGHNEKEKESEISPLSPDLGYAPIDENKYKNIMIAFWKKGHTPSALNDDVIIDDVLYIDNKALKRLANRVHQGFFWIHELFRKIQYDTVHILNSTNMRYFLAHFLSTEQAIDPRADLTLDAFVKSGGQLTLGDFHTEFPENRFKHQDKSIIKYLLSLNKKTANAIEDNISSYRHSYYHSYFLPSNSNVSDYEVWSDPKKKAKEKVNLGGYMNDKNVLLEYTFPNQECADNAYIQISPTKDPKIIDFYSVSYNLNTQKDGYEKKIKSSYKNNKPITINLPNEYSRSFQHQYAFKNFFGKSKFIEFKIFDPSYIPTQWKLSIGSTNPECELTTPWSMFFTLNLNQGKGLKNLIKELTFQSSSTAEFTINIK